MSTADDTQKFGGHGTLVCVVGPSGGGKDTLIDAARELLGDNPRFVFPRRLISRADQTGEVHDVLTAPDTDLENCFLKWNAHGETYALPAEIKDDLSAGRIAVVNVSRGIIDEARRAWQRLAVIHITAPEPVLRERLVNRGREDSAAIEARLARKQTIFLHEQVALVTIENGGALQTAIDRFVNALQRLAV